MEPITREEKFLSAAATGDTSGLPTPITREEVYLKAIAENSGGGGGTSNYELLSNKPKINNVELSGNKTTKELGIDAGDPTTENAMSVAVTVGGISAGTSYEAGTKLEKILSDMLEPTLYPAFTAPSASLSASPTTKLYEKGATASITFTVSFNRGTINPAYGTSGYRAGAAESYALNNGTAQSGNTFTETVAESNKTFTGTVNYAGGEQPKDSKGNDYSTPLASGSVTTSAINYEFVDAIWSNDSDITTIAKEALVSKSTKVKAFSFPAATVANPEVFDVPASWTVTTVEVLNTLSNQWETATSQFDVSNTTHNDAAGNSVNYKRYTCNLGMALGARQVRFKWS